MSYFRKKLERRTFSEDRYYILIKRQKSGEATMRDLDELDEIVNRVPDIREKVLRENFEEFAINDDGDAGQNVSETPAIKPRSLWSRIGGLFKNVFTLNIHASQQKFSALC